MTTKERKAKIKALHQEYVRLVDEGGRPENMKYRRAYRRATLEVWRKIHELDKNF